MTFAQRFLLSLIIVLVILFCLAAFGYFTGGWDDDPDGPMVRFGLASAETRPELCMDDEARERITGPVTITVNGTAIGDL